MKKHQYLIYKEFLMKINQQSLANIVRDNKPEAVLFDTSKASDKQKLLDYVKNQEVIVLKGKLWKN